MLKVVNGFLTNHDSNLSYKGTRSENKQMSGGGPQGTIIGRFLFIVLIKSVGLANLNKTNLLIISLFLKLLT